MVPILAPLTPCFQSSHEQIDSKVMKASGHGRVCISEDKTRTTHPESFIDAVQFMMRFYHVHLNQSYEISDHDVLNKIQKPNFAIASIAMLRSLGDEMDTLTETHTLKAFISAMEYFLEVLIQKAIQHSNVPTNTHILSDNAHDEYLSIWTRIGHNAIQHLDTSSKIKSPPVKLKHSSMQHSLMALPKSQSA